MTSSSKHTKDLVEKVEKIMTTLGSRSQSSEPAGQSIGSGVYRTTEYHYRKRGLEAIYSITSFRSGEDGWIGSSTEVKYNYKVVLDAIENSEKIKVYIPGPWEKKIEQLYKKARLKNR